MFVFQGIPFIDSAFWDFGRGGPLVSQILAWRRSHLPISKIRQQLEKDERFRDVICQTAQNVNSCENWKDEINFWVWNWDPEVFFCCFGH